MTKQSFKKRWEIYWYYYKIPTIVLGLIILVMAIMISQCVQKVTPDCKVVLFTHKNVPSEVVTAMERELQKFADDYNNDGKIVVEVVDCSYNPNNPNKSIMIAQLSKLQGELGLSESILFITDIQGFKYLNEQDLFERHDLFKDLDGKGYNLKNTPFDNAVNAAVPDFFAGDYYISKRNVTDRFAEEKKQQSDQLLKKLISAYSQ